MNNLFYIELDDVKNQKHCKIIAATREEALEVTMKRLNKFSGIGTRNYRDKGVEAYSVWQWVDDSHADRDIIATAAIHEFQFEMTKEAVLECLKTI